MVDSAQTSDSTLAEGVVLLLPTQMFAEKYTGGYGYLNLKELAFTIKFSPTLRQKKVFCVRSSRDYTFLTLVLRIAGLAAHNNLHVSQLLRVARFFFWILGMKNACLRRPRKMFKEAAERRLGSCHA